MGDMADMLVDMIYDPYWGDGWDGQEYIPYKNYKKLKCKYCGFTGVYWRKYSGRWHLHNTQDGTPHKCSLTFRELKQKLNMTTEYKFDIAGVRFGDYQKIKKIPPVGTLFDLVLERSNPADPNAIRIDYEKVKLGYVPKNSEVYRELHKNRGNEVRPRCYLQSWNPNNPTHTMIVCRVEIASEEKL